MNREPFEMGEWYHCFTRGVDKRQTFLVEEDFRRFSETLYLANSEVVMHRSDFPNVDRSSLFQRPRGAPHTAIGAYCLMPNHYHLLLQEVSEGGIVSFMQKLGTSYTMYFNGRNERVGNLFVKPFRSRHIKSDNHLRHAVHYIHLNPVELFESNWKKGLVKNLADTERKLRDYIYSSLPDYYGMRRPEGRILDSHAVEFLSDEMPLLTSMLKDAASYYQEMGSFR